MATGSTLTFEWLAHGGAGLDAADMTIHGRIVRAWLAGRPSTRAALVALCGPSAVVRLRRLIQSGWCDERADGRLVPARWPDGSGVVAASEN
jgi:hypothetical protein